MGNKYSKARKGLYKPKNPHKWVSPNNIIFRSSIEQRWFNYFDLNKDVISIASEKIIVPYFNPIKNRPARYYIDLIVKYKDKEGNIQVKLIEIKSSGETRAPKKPQRITENYKSALATYLVNQAKWDAAIKYAQKRNWEFVILTEREL
jgi:hypothetical protein